MAVKRTVIECRPWHFKQVVYCAHQENNTEAFWNSMTKPQKLSTRILVRLEELGASSSQIKNIKKVILWEDDILEYILYQPDLGLAKMIALDKEGKP